MTIAQIHKRVAEDAFQYNSVRVLGKIVSITPQAFRAVAEDPYDPSASIEIDIFLLKQKQIEKGKIYEFLGEIEQVKKQESADAAAEQDDGEMQDDDG